MKLANVTIKRDSFGSTSVRQNVTPAEVMFLVAEHQINAGGDPIVKLEEIPDDRDVKIKKQLVEQLNALQGKFDSNKEPVTEEIAKRRQDAFNAASTLLQEKIDNADRLIQLRQLAPTQERNRLMQIYRQDKVKAMFPGAIPALPTTFEEARQAGLGASNDADAPMFANVGEKVPA